MEPEDSEPKAKIESPRALAQSPAYQEYLRYLEAWRHYSRTRIDDCHKPNTTVLFCGDREGTDRIRVERLGFLRGFLRITRVRIKARASMRGLQNRSLSRHELVSHRWRREFPAIARP